MNRVHVDLTGVTGHAGVKQVDKLDQIRMNNKCTIVPDFYTLGDFNTIIFGR